MDCASGLEPPVVWYDHGAGCSITGGFVYRGAALPGLAGHYFFSDYCAGFLASLEPVGSGVVLHEWPIDDIGNVLSFGMDARGEPYLLTAGGEVHRIVEGG